MFSAAPHGGSLSLSIHQVWGSQYAKRIFRKNEENIRAASIIIENAEIVDRYGSANAEFIKRILWN